MKLGNRLELAELHHETHERCGQVIDARDLAFDSAIKRYKTASNVPTEVVIALTNGASRVSALLNTASYIGVAVFGGLDEDNTVPGLRDLAAELSNQAIELFAEAQSLVKSREGTP